MRCIEINGFQYEEGKEYGLIETWDVLKWEIEELYDAASKINRNMRCIEIR